MGTLRDIDAGAIDLQAGRRAFMRSVGLGAALAGTFASIGEAGAQTPDLDVPILNFVLQLEYLEAEFHLRAAFGVGLSDDLVTGRGQVGGVSGGRKVAFANPVVAAIASEIADDEKNHVIFLRSALGQRAVARPALNIGASFQAAAVAAGIIGPAGSFDPYENDLSFLFAAYNFVDLGVTAYIGAAPALVSKTYLAAASSILGAEAYHAGALRTLIFSQQNQLANTITAKFSGLQATLSNAQDAQGVGADQSTLDGGFPSPANITPTDPNGLAFSRTPRQVLDVAFGAKGANSGLFFPAGLQGGSGQAAVERL